MREIINSILIDLEPWQIVLGTLALYQASFVLIQTLIRLFRKPKLEIQLDYATWEILHYYMVLKLDPNHS